MSTLSFFSRQIAGAAAASVATHVSRSVLKCPRLIKPAARWLSVSATALGKERRACIANRALQQVEPGDNVPPTKLPAPFWTEVADEKSVRDAPLYINNIESYIGTVKLPVGLVGPLKISMDDDPRPDSVDLISKTYLVPMATTEAVLLASYNRGAKAITQSGGAWASVNHRQMIRAPCFAFKTVRDASAFLKWFQTSSIQGEIKHVIAQEPHCHLVKLQPIITDRFVHVHVGIDSEDAAGQNMVTYCGRVVMNLVQKHYVAPAVGGSGQGILASYIEGGFNAGKRGSVGVHLAQGKGHHVTVECHLPASVVRSVLHTTPRDIVQFQRLHSRTASFIGTLGTSAHVANGLAAFYIANGQDAACVAESHAAVTYFDVETDPGTQEERLYAAMTLPSLIVSTVGGGTHLPSQNACLNVIGAAHSNELAGVLAGSCLAGELSFYAAMTSGEFDQAHWNATHKIHKGGKVVTE